MRNHPFLLSIIFFFHLSAQAVEFGTLVPASENDYGFDLGSMAVGSHRGSEAGISIAQEPSIHPDPTGISLAGLALMGIAAARRRAIRPCRARAAIEDGQPACNHHDDVIHGGKA